MAQYNIGIDSEKVKGLLGWEFTDRLFVIDFIKKMVYPTNNAKLKLGG
jgi:hypothetical protein